MKSHSPGSLLIAGSIVVAALCTIVMDNGWWVWAPVLLAILVVTTIKAKLKL
ncbi:MAG TPA: hypothetical protein VH120_15585 [Gemmataceae bacterium]|jgi:hypothetical protein|nr:hypothetical protein [Gemmataceae bacterium]